MNFKKLLCLMISVSLFVSILTFSSTITGGAIDQPGRTYKTVLKFDAAELARKAGSYPRYHNWIGPEYMSLTTNTDTVNCAPDRTESLKITSGSNASYPNGMGKEAQFLIYTNEFGDFVGDGVRVWVKFEGGTNNFVDLIIGGGNAPDHSYRLTSFVSGGGWVDIPYSSFGYSGNRAYNLGEYDDNTLAIFNHIYVRYSHQGSTPILYLGELQVYSDEPHEYTVPISATTSTSVTTKATTTMPTTVPTIPMDKTYTICNDFSALLPPPTSLCNTSNVKLNDNIHFGTGTNEQYSAMFVPKTDAANSYLQVWLGSTAYVSPTVGLKGAGISVWVDFESQVFNTMTFKFVLRNRTNNPTVDLQYTSSNYTVSKGGQYVDVPYTDFKRGTVTILNDTTAGATPEARVAAVSLFGIYTTLTAADSSKVTAVYFDNIRTYTEVPAATTTSTITSTTVKAISSAIISFNNTVNNISAVMTDTNSANADIKAAIQLLKAPTDDLEARYFDLSPAEKAEYPALPGAVENARFLLFNGNTLVDNAFAFSTLQEDIDLIPSNIIEPTLQLINDMKACINSYDAFTSEKKAVFDRYYAGSTINAFRAYVMDYAGSYVNPYVISSDKLHGLDMAKNSIGIFTNSFQCNANAQIKVLKATGEELTTGSVGTGMKVELYKNGSLTEQYTVILYGDVDGNGTIDAIDLLILKRHLLGIFTITGDLLIASNANRDVLNSITAIDLLKIKQSILKLNSIYQG